MVTFCPVILIAVPAETVKIWVDEFINDEVSASMAILPMKEQTLEHAKDLHLIKPLFATIGPSRYTSEPEIYMLVALTKVAMRGELMSFRVPEQSIVNAPEILNPVLLDVNSKNRSPEVIITSPLTVSKMFPLYPPVKWFAILEVNWATG